MKRIYQLNDLAHAPFGSQGVIGQCSIPATIQTCSPHTDFSVLPAAFHLCCPCPSPGLLSASRCCSSPFCVSFSSFQPQRTVLFVSLCFQPPPWLLTVLRLKPGGQTVTGGRASSAEAPVGSCRLSAGVCLAQSVLGWD